MKVKVNGYLNFTLDPNSIYVRKMAKKQVQVMLKDMGKTAIITDTERLMTYLEHLYEQVRLVYIKQNPSL